MSDASADRVVVLNSVSGTGEHAETVRSLADEHGYVVRESRGSGDVIAHTREAIRGGASVIAAAGGDGTLNPGSGLT